MRECDELSHIVNVMRKQSIRFSGLGAVSVVRVCDVQVMKERGDLVDRILAGMNEEASLSVSSLQDLKKRDGLILEELRRLDWSSEGSVPCLSGFRFICPVFHANVFANLLKEVRWIDSLLSLRVCHKQSTSTPQWASNRRQPQ